MLRRYGCPPLRWIDSTTGARIRASRATRRSYEMAAPGDPIHVGIKKIGKVPTVEDSELLVGDEARPAFSWPRLRVIHYAVDALPGCFTTPDTGSFRRCWSGSTTADRHEDRRPIWSRDDQERLGYVSLDDKREALGRFDRPFAGGEE